MKEILLKKNFWEQNKNPFRLITLGLLLIYLLLLIKTAWIGDDAYITFRTIDNFVNGYGLRWNIAERVQSYTHPLWLFLLSAIYFFTREIFFTAIITSIILSVATVYLLAFIMSRSNQNMILVLLAVIFSKAFIDYSTSGLENPLTNFLLVLFFYVYFKQEFNNKNKTFFLSLIYSLILVNRMDVILLVLPGFIYYIIKSKSYKHYSIILLGFLPFAIWELFSLLYYGFPFPNTAYAKLNTGINRIDSIYQGLRYYYASFKLDPISLTLITFIVIISSFKFNRKYLPLILGVLLYLLYVLWVGGDFMNGRFFTAPLVIVFIILGLLEINSNKLFVISVVGILAISLSGPFPTILGEKWPRDGLLINEDGICDERVFYMPSSGLLYSIKGMKMPLGQTVDGGRLARASNSKFEVINNIGFWGYYAGPKCFILDDFALSDPLLSRLPAKKDSRIGHFKRAIPEGYVETLITGQNKIQNQNLAEYYDKLSLVTRGNILSINRIKKIWKINTGQYNYLLDDYTQSINAHN